MIEDREIAEAAADIVALLGLVGHDDEAKLLDALAVSMARHARHLALNGPNRFGVTKRFAFDVATDYDDPQGIINTLRLAKGGDRFITEAIADTRDDQLRAKALAQEAYRESRARREAARAKGGVETDSSTAPPVETPAVAPATGATEGQRASAATDDSADRKTIAERQVDIDSLRAQYRQSMNELEKTMRDAGKSEAEIDEVLELFRD